MERACEVPRVTIMDPGTEAGMTGAEDEGAQHTFHTFSAT